MNSLTDQKKVRQLCMQMSFLMSHQQVLPDLRELAASLTPTDTDDPYLQGARDALLLLVEFLETKGNR